MWRELDFQGRFLRPGREATRALPPQAEVVLQGVAEALLRSCGGGGGCGYDCWPGSSDKPWEGAALSGGRDASQAYKQAEAAALGNPLPERRRRSDLVRVRSAGRGGAGRECSGRSPGRRPFPCPRAAEGRRLLAPGPAPPPGPASTASRACGCRCAVNKASLPGRPLATEEGFPGRVPPRMWAAAAEGSGPCGLLLPVPRPASPKLALRVPSREGLSRKSRVQDETDSTFPRQH